MKRLIALLLFVTSAQAQTFDTRTGRQVSGYSDMAFNATLNFDVATNNTFKITLTGNVTSSSMSGVGASGGGEVVRFIICQDATGNRTFTWPTTLYNAPTIHTTANECKIYLFVKETSGYLRYAGGSYSTGGGAVSSVFGRSGVVTAQANDYAWGDISGKPATFTPSAHAHDYGSSDITNKPTLGTAAALNVAATGDAASGEVVKGSDSRMSDARTPVSHSHAEADVTSLVSDLAGKAASSHTHNASDVNAGTLNIGRMPFGTANQLLKTNAGASAQEHATLAVGTAGTDFAVAFGAGSITLNLPTASASNRGALSSTDWSTFNGKQAALGFTPANSTVTLTASSPLTGGGDLTTNRSFGCQTASTSQAGCLSSADWNTFNGKQAALGFTPENSANKNATNGYAGLSSGLLAAAQLPNPSAGALGGVRSITCSGTDKLSAIGTDGIPVCSTDQTSAGGPMVSFLTADTAGATTNTLANTGMSFSISANTTYSLDCEILFTVSATASVGLTLGVNGPGTPTQVSLMRFMNTTATAFRIDSSTGTAWAAKVGATATTVTTLSRARFSGLIENGATAGTLNIQYANIGTTGSTIVKRGSWCKVQ